jgi:hypothetical protein
MRGGSFVIRNVSAVALAVLAIGLGPVTLAQAAATPAAKPLPNPCQTFTAKSAEALLQVSRRTHLSETLGSSKDPAARTCTIRHGKTRLVVAVSRREGGTGSEENCYRYPKLGRGSLLCVSNAQSSPFSFAVFRKHHLWIGDGINVRVPHKGRRLYKFALAQLAGRRGLRYG